ncbi:MAG: peptide ABC transporter substrate-binding protein, partial [Burkholderiaceae bacterium]|nr:peptide ABC transporter substrate-binding protein [Burkholderiaceae bacterium]
MFHNFHPVLTDVQTPQSGRKTPLGRPHPAVRVFATLMGWTFVATAMTAQAGTAQTLTELPSQAAAASSHVVAAIAAVLPPLEQLHPTQVLNRGNGAEPESLDPALTSSTNAAHGLRDLLEGLTSTTAQGKIVGGVAHAWQRLDDLTWAFDLRPAKWSNGDPVTADDFVYSFRRFFTPSTASVYSTTFQDFLFNAREIVEGKLAPESLGAHAESPTRLILRTQFPVAFLPELLAHGSFLPVHRATVERHGSQWTRPANWVGNGAFTLTEWRVNDRIVATRRPDYWDAENVRITQVRFFPIESEAAETKLYQSGQLDMTTTIAPGSYPLHLKQRPDDIRNSPALTVRYYSLNNEDPVLK